MPTEIIAEIAQGYEGKPVLADLLVKGALTSGADAVKLQLVYADELCIPDYPYYGLFKSLEMPYEVWENISRTVHEKGKKIYFDIYGDDSLQVARKLGADGIKISATDFYNTDLIQSAVNTFSRVFISCSGVPSEDLTSLINGIEEPGKITFLHGFQAEPTATEDNHLLRIGTLKTMFPKVQIGFMDHSEGSRDEAYYLAVMALAQGISCIEKHITLDYSLQIEDYISALSVDRFCDFVSLIRRLEPALGSSALELIDKEVAYKKKAGKVVVAKTDLPEGHLITKADISLKRVSVVPLEAAFSRKEDVLGKKLLRGVSQNNTIENSTIQ